jgi:PKD repeat protein
VSTDGAGLSYEWDLGDGTTGGGLTVTHTYTQDGTYTIVFTASDTCGYSAVATMTITVAPDCIPVTGVTFVYAPSNPVIQSPVVFTATHVPSDAAQTVTYAWDLGDGSSGSGQTVSHTYPLSDTYTVIVTATNCSGAGVVTYTEDVPVALSDGAQTPIDPTLGGTLIYTDSQGNPTTVEVPGSAISEPITLLYTPVPSPTQPATSTLQFINHTFDLDAYRGGQLLSGFVFSKPVTITIHYSDYDVQGVDESNLRLYYWTGGVWDDVINTCTPPSTYTHNLSQNVLGVPICHLTRIGVKGPALETIYLPIILRNS